MARKLEQLETALLRLEPHDRATLAKTLLDSLDDLSDDEYERLWTEEAEARYRAHISGKTAAVDGDEVFARARARKR
jgi:putative addiction module component (TIGR02574 family)